VKVKAPTERNFRRAKVKPGRRRAPRRFISWKAIRVIVTVMVVVYGGYRGFSLVLNARVLEVSTIDVHGNVRLSSGEVAELARGLYGHNILTADLVAQRRSLLESPWIADAALRRVLPSTIEIYVSERRPFGISRIGGQLYLIDPSGVVIDEFGPQYAEFDLPIIDGLVINRLVRGPKNAKSPIDATRARLAARVIDAVAGHPLAQRVSQVDVTDLRNAIVTLDDDPAQLYVGDERFRERLQSYVEVASAFRERFPDIDYVDLRFEERVYVRPRGGTRTAIKAAVNGRQDGKPGVQR
jgi:cell division protein FtsQ